MNGQTNRLGSGGRLLATIALAMAVVLQLFLIHMVTSLHLDIAAQQDELATKADLRNLAVNLGPPDPAMTVLESKCTGCHAKDKFTGAHGISGDIPEIVEHMAAKAGSGIREEELPRLGAALTLMKCGRCHTGDRLKEMAILSPSQRWELILEMSRKPGSEISPQDARRIRDAYGLFWTWHMQ